ncbi:MAG: hypothetical protein R3212_05860, partial [Xanthomonadales bacterium]|nr:hypothetical protein [Xanthomonadales bacterium]
LGVFSAEMLANAYDIPAPQGDLLILMRHRALLFGVVGSIILVSAFRPHLQPAAMIAAFVSMAGFIALTLGSGNYGEKIHGVMLIDVVGVVLLVIAAVLRFRTAKSND